MWWSVDRNNKSVSRTESFIFRSHRSLLCEIPYLCEIHISV